MLCPVQQEQVLIELLNFSGSLATKCLSLNNKPFMITPMISLDKYNWRFNTVDDCLKGFHST